MMPSLADTCLYAEKMAALWGGGGDGSGGGGEGRGEADQMSLEPGRQETISVL